MLHNVTIAPHARATAVQDPEIDEVRNLKSGLVSNSVRFIESMSHARHVQVRSRLLESIQAGKPRLACAICGVPVYIAASSLKAFFFKHRVEDGSCPAVTRSSLSENQIRAMKYRGAQESKAHKRTKALIERSIRADARFESVSVEQTWRSGSDPKLLRRPDVQATCSGVRFAFEAQLSTTFLSVVVDRKAFYRAEGALLVWVLPYFDPGYRRLMVDDILFNNNSNVLVVDRETAEASEAVGSFVVKCHYRKPVLAADDIDSEWECHLARWDELTFDLEKQTIFAFDTQGEEKALTERRSRNGLRDEFLAFVCNDPLGENARSTWTRFKYAFSALGIVLPGIYGPGSELRDLVRGVLSATAGAPRGYDYEKLIQAAHHLERRFPQALIPFGRALKLAGHAELLVTQDRRGLWRIKADRLRDGMRSGTISRELRRDLDQLSRFLFPELYSSEPQT